MLLGREPHAGQGAMVKQSPCRPSPTLGQACALVSTPNWNRALFLFASVPISNSTSFPFFWRFQPSFPNSCFDTHYSYLGFLSATFADIRCVFFLLPRLIVEPPYPPPFRYYKIIYILYYSLQPNSDQTCLHTI